MKLQTIAYCCSIGILTINALTFLGFKPERNSYQFSESSCSSVVQKTNRVR